MTTNTLPAGLRVAVADDERDTRQFLQEILQRLGHQVVCTAATGRELVEACRATPPDVVITDIKMPDMDGIDAVATIGKERPVPTVLVTAYSDPETVARAGPDEAQAFLVKPIKPSDIGPAVALALRRFEQTRAMRKEADDLRQSLEDRKLIERAKGIVIRRLGADEAEAFRRMRKLSSDRNLKLVEVARSVLKAEEVFAELER
jgi:response regulator NasT